MILEALARMFGRRPTARGMPASYGGAKHLAMSPDPTVRGNVAAAADAAPEILFFLARDLAPEVRLAVAHNLRTPRQADLILALDNVPEVRGAVAEKIAPQVTGLARDEAAQLWQVTIELLEALGRDDLTRVRRLVAEASKTVEKVPPSLMTKLGRDRATEVAVPALGYVGPIADEALVEIVEQAPEPQVVNAVAQRPSIGPKVSEAVVARGDEPAIATLLANKSATLAPETLERVVDRAPPVVAWHEPLVTRPYLTDTAAVRLAGFVADRLVQALQQRADLDPETAQAIQIILQSRRIAPAHLDMQMEGPIVAEPADENDPVMRARRLYANGALGEDVLLDAIPNDRNFLIAALSLRAKLPPAVVAKILTSHSGKGLTSLAWKAGYTMRLALQLQLRLGQLPPKARLIAAGGGAFPLTQAEMEWQIEFFRSLVADGI